MLIKPSSNILFIFKIILNKISNRQIVSSVNSVLFSIINSLNFLSSVINNKLKLKIKKKLKTNQNWQKVYLLNFYFALLTKLTQIFLQLQNKQGI